MKNNTKNSLYSILCKVRNVITKDYDTSDDKNIELIKECIKPTFIDISNHFILNEMIKNEKDILLFILISLFDNNLNDKINDIDEYFLKIEHNFIHSYDIIYNEIKNIIEQFFYDKNGFFKIKSFDNDYIKYFLLKNYKLNKVSDYDKILLFIVCLFQNNYMNFSEMNIEKSFLDMTNNFYVKLIKNYDKYDEKIHYDKITLLKIDETNTIDKIINNYQKFKIFFTYEDFKKNFKDVFDENIN